MITQCPVCYRMLGKGGVSWFEAEGCNALLPGVNKAHCNLHSNVPPIEGQPVQCCVCHKIRVEGQWYGPVPRREASHGYCPVCFEEAKQPRV